jgi:DNA-directed RNA polymerase omega subunit
MGIRPIEDYLAKADGSVYRLVRMAANRAMEISEGKPTLIKNATTDKVTTLALEEIAMGKIGYRYVKGGPKPAVEVDNTQDLFKEIQMEVEAKTKEA